MIVQIRSRTCRPLGAILAAATTLACLTALAGPASKLSPTPPNPAGESPAMGWINVRNYGAVGDGRHDDGPALRAALMEAGRRGGGTVYLPAGDYRGGVQGNRENGQYRAVGILPSAVTLRGDGMGSTILGFLPDQPQSAFILLNDHIGSGGDRDILLEDLTLDGFAAQQHPRFSQNGLGVLRMRNLICRRVRFRNVYGSASAGIGESFHAEFGLSTDALFDGCEVVGDSGTTASGFSADASTNVTYVACRARGMKVSCGFTHNGCAHVTYIGCQSYGNPNGFNSEVSRNISYIGCTSGEESVASPAFPYPPSTLLGNTGPYGQFIVNGDRDVLIQACTSRNGATGVWIQGSLGVSITGGDFSNNKNFGVHVDSISLPEVRLSGPPLMHDNGKADLDLPVGRSPLTGILPAPPLPRSGQETQSPFPMATTIYFSGEVSGLMLDGVALPIHLALVRVPAGSRIKITYRRSPKWIWSAG